MSSLDFLKPIIHLLPEIKNPDRPLGLKEKLIWVGIALALFFIMSNITAFGVDTSNMQGLEFLQVVTASSIGTLLTAGIGPIVLASIFLQLFNGAGILHFDMQDPEDKKTFFGVQKLLAIILAIFEGIMFVFLGRLDLISNTFFMQTIVVSQIALSSIILLYLDEIVSKYGVGSGISLFIAANVSFTIISGALSLLGFNNPNGVLQILQAGGADAIPNAILYMTPFYFTIIVFLIIVYAEGMKVELPLSFGLAKGVGGRFPIKFLYVSNIPVILTAALLLNIQFLAAVLPAKDQGVMPDGFDLVGSIGWVVNVPKGTMINGEEEFYPDLQDGFLYLITQRGLSPNPLLTGRSVFDHWGLILSSSTPIFKIPEIMHLLIYAIVFTGLCILFGMFWVETAGMGPKDVASQLQSSGFQIPGFRRDPRAIENVVNRYIPVIVILGSAFVGIIAVLADLTGALGTGTGILLTVGILHRFYEELKSMNAFGLHPGFGRMFGI
ncbi:preprotein translocase subunit SecY [Candidatus Micrarchaeota archaeon]|nr:preprotein translocase subunit SecY [Candidatus Micrarchaeota archaeon]